MSSSKDDKKEDFEPLIKYLTNTYPKYKIVDVSETVNEKNLDSYIPSRTNDKITILISKRNIHNEELFNLCIQLGQLNIDEDYKYILFIQSRFLIAGDIDKTCQESIQQFITNEEYECKSCFMKMEEVHICGYCEYTICGRCLEKIVKNNKCPQCRTQLL